LLKICGETGVIIGIFAVIFDGVTYLVAREQQLVLTLLTPQGVEMFFATQDHDSQHAQTSQ